MRTEPIRSVKGTRDLLPPDTNLWQRVEAEAHRVFAAYHYGEIRTPMLEETALFARSVGADTDIVMKEMYTFRDRDEESLTLASGGHGFRGARLHRAQPVQPGRHSQALLPRPHVPARAPAEGRYRQFYQIGAEVLGSQSPLVDAEVLEMLVLFLERVGIREYQLLLNSVGCPKCRAEYLNGLREALQSVKASMCADCQRRAETNPLRVLDCKVEADQPIIEKLPKIIDHLDPECRQHFDRVTSELQARGLAYQVTPRLVRGLDYYTRTTFEITSGALGAQNAVVGGGRYDGLSEMLGGPPTPGIGFSIGQDRLILAVQAAAVLKSEAPLGGLRRLDGGGRAPPGGTPGARAARARFECRDRLRPHENQESHGRRQQAPGALCHHYRRR